MMSENEGKNGSKVFRFSPLARPFTVNRSSLSARSYDFHSLHELNLGASDYNQTDSEATTASYLQPYSSDNDLTLLDDSYFHTSTLEEYSRDGTDFSSSRFGSTAQMNVTGGVLSYGDEGRRIDQSDYPFSSGKCSFHEYGESVTEGPQLFGPAYHKSHEKASKFSTKGMEQINAESDGSSFKVSKLDLRSYARTFDSQSTDSHRVNGKWDVVRKAGCAKLRITCPKASGSVNLEVQGVETSVPVENSSIVFNQDDSELDSPCWPGTQVYQSISRVSDSACVQHSSNDLECCTKLNPLAPRFSPCNANSSVDNNEKQCDAVASTSSKNTSSKSVGLSSGDEDLNAERYSSKVSPVETPLSSDVSDPKHSYGYPVLELNDVSEPVGSKNFKSEAGACNRLNPLAPQFVPLGFKRNGDICEKECCENDSLSFQTTAVAFSSEDCEIIDSIKAGLCPSEASNVFGTRSYNDVHEPQVELVCPKKVGKSTLLTSSHMGQPLIVEEYHTSNNRLLLGPNATCSMKDIEGTEYDSSTNRSGLVSGNILTSSSFGFDVLSDFSEAHQRSSKSSSSNIDVKLLLSTMHDLSELLIKNSSNDLNSMNEHEHDTVQGVISNLNFYIKSKSQKTIMSGSLQPSTSYGHNTWNSAGHSKNLIKEGQATRTKEKIALHDIVRKGNCSIFSKEKKFESFPSGIDAAMETEEAISKALATKAFQENYGTEEKMHPQALLYRCLWLKTEAALSFMNYKALQLRNEVERCTTDRNIRTELLN